MSAPKARDDGMEARARWAVPMVGAFALPRFVRQLEPTVARILLRELAAAGVTHVLTEGLDLPSWLIAEIRSAGMRLGGGLACFSDHASRIRPVPERLRPVTSDGARRPTMGWYQGIIPTDREYNGDVVRACRSAVDAFPLDLFVLDFIRWPIHWEHELREGQRPLESSFDAISLRRFSEETGIDLGRRDSATAARLILDRYNDQWIDFKCRVINDLIARIVAEIRAGWPGLPIGAFIVPGTDKQRRRYAGQDVPTMATQLDLLLPMAYHAVLGRTPAWVAGLVAEVREQSAGAVVVPALQVTADRDISGGRDWGEPFPPEGFGRAIQAAIDGEADGFVAFPAHGLDRLRLAELKQAAGRLTA